MNRLDQHWADMEQKLRELLTLTTPLLSARDVGHSWEFIAANEFELALETVAAGIAGQKVGPEVVKLVNELAAAMELTESVSYQMFQRCLP